MICNQKESNSIHVDLNHTDSNQPITYDSTKIGSIHDLAHICAIEKILTSPGTFGTYTFSSTRSNNVFNGKASDPPSP